MTKQILEVQVTRKVTITKDKVESSQVDDRLSKDMRVNATLSEFIADTRTLRRSKHEGVWVADDGLVPAEAGTYEIIRKEVGGAVSVSLRKASQERWSELPKENKLYVSQNVPLSEGAKRDGRLAVYGYRSDFSNGALNLDVYTWSCDTALLAEVEQTQAAATGALKPTVRA